MAKIIHVKLEEDVHRRLKMTAAAAGISMQDFIIKFMEKELVKGKPRK
jgi:predicted HicB family RNase H-like nuclease